MKTIAETGTELSVGNKRLEETSDDAAKHEVRTNQKPVFLVWTNQNQGLHTLTKGHPR